MLIDFAQPTYRVLLRQTIVGELPHHAEPGTPPPVWAAGEVHEASGPLALRLLNLEHAEEAGPHKPLATELAGGR